MNTTRFLVLIMFLFGSLSLGEGQNQSVQNGAPQTGAQPGTSARSVPVPALSGFEPIDALNLEGADDVPQIPALLGGPGSSLAFRTEMERSNYLNSGVSVGAGYDDNALLGSGDQIGNTTFSVFPTFGIAQSTSRARWEMRYGAGVTVNQRLSSRNQGAHDLNFDSEFRLSPHVNLRVAEDFSLTTGMLAGRIGSTFAPGVSGGNGTLITPLANTRSSQTVVETNYHFARNDLIGASGSYYNLHYSDVSTGSESLADTQTATASGFWLHRIVHSDWLGVGYSFQRITYGPIGETRVHGFNIVNTLSLSRAFMLTAFVGPEYSDNYGIAATGPEAGQLASFAAWGTAGGVDLTWRNQRTSVSGGYSRRVSSGSGIVGAVRLQDVHGGFRRELRPGLAAGVTVSYGDNQSITFASINTATSFKVTSVGASLERNLGRSFGFRIEYFRDLQSLAGASNPSLNYDVNRNRFSVTLSYQWTKPLGR